MGQKKKKIKLTWGFTLIEMLVVLMVIALLAGLAVGNLRMFNGILLRMELSKLYTVAVCAQRTAQSSGQPQEIIIDVAGRSYSYNQHRYQLPRGISFGAAPGVFGPPGSPTHAVLTPHSFSKDHIIFYPDGVIQSGAVYLTDGVHTCALTVSVSAISFLRKYRYDGAWHLVS